MDTTKKIRHLRSTSQINALNLARSLRHLNALQNIDPFPFQNNQFQYCLAVLSEGLGETQARRFLAKCGIPALTPDEFYSQQNKLDSKIEIILEKHLQETRASLGPQTVFGVDCSWSARRNAQSAITIFMDTKTNKIFDKVIVSRDPNISDFYFRGPSNMMEFEAIKRKASEIKTNYKYIGFVHDFDVHTAPCLQPEKETGQLIEFLDPGHLKKTLDNIFKQHNTENYLYQLKNTILSRFSEIVRNKTLTIEQKVAEWYNIPNFIINSTSPKIKKGYLVPLTSSSQKEKKSISCDEPHSESQPTLSFQDSIDISTLFNELDEFERPACRVAPNVARAALLVDIKVKKEQLQEN